MNKFRNILLAGTILVGSITPSFAYYSKSDYKEYFEIPTNSSAFLIPLQGANLTNQAQFGSKDYLQSNKVAAKRVEVPHVILSGTGTLSNYYVPSAKLFLLDRTPYNREWTDSTNTGTSNKLQGFHFESKDSLNVETDITIAASVSESDAATFFYYFGTRNDDKTLPYDSTQQYQSDAYYSASFASVGYGRSLSDVMDTVGRGKVQSELANAFGQYDLIDAIAHKSDIMKTVTTNVTAYFKERGVTIEYIGYANSLNYDKAVQDAIDKVYISKMNAFELQAQQPVMPIRQQIANIKVTEGFAGALGKWNGSLPQLPNFMAIPSSVIDWVTSFFTPKAMASDINPHK